MSVRGDDWVFPMTREESNYSPGLTIREYAAIHLAACSTDQYGSREEWARSNVESADILIAELERTRK